MYNLSIVGIFICFCLTVDCLTYRGPITINGGTTAGIAGGNCGVTVSGNSVTLSQSCSPRVYLMKDSSNFYKMPSLLGKSIQFTVNIPSATCGCNAALYLIQYPSSVTGGDYYCDAQCPSGLCCNEIDIFEANTHAFQGTAHCGGGDNPCKWGCGVNWKSANGYGPSGSKINTAQPFTVAVSFVASGSTLTSMHVKLSQSGQTLSYALTDSTCNSMKSGYISGLSSSLSAANQYVMAISYWGGDMNWLDGCSSGGSCPSSSSVTFSNIQILNSIVAIEGDASSSTDSGFVGTPGFYAVIALCVLIATLAAIAIVIVVKKRQTHETV